MRKYTLMLCTLVGTLFFNRGSAQLVEKFDDGNFSDNPTWIGNITDWQVNSQQQLQSNNTIANSTFYLSTACTLATQAQWEFYVNLTFNTSSANYVDAYLTASQSDLTNTALTGYFVRIGGTDDEICLYRKDASGAVVKLIDGINGVTNTSNNFLKIKVTRTASNSFNLFRDITGTGSNYISEGTVTDANYLTSAYFGFVVKQSTASFFQRHFFDDLEVKAYTPDVTPPAITSINATTNKTIEVLFNEPVETASAQTLGNYQVNNGLGSPVTAVQDVNNAALVRLSFSGTFINGTPNILTVSGVQDVAGNATTNATSSFSFFVPQRYDVVIDEIMSGPTPVVALPNAEFLELRNTSAQPINLQGWKITSLTTTSGAIPSFVLKPDSLVIICGTSAGPLLDPYGRVISVTSFPSLLNTGTTLTLFAKDNSIIHSVSYNNSWYQNTVKSNGGWTLEMIDTKNPCSGASNWKASTDARGGTPGIKNSVDGVNKDVTPPALSKAVATNANTLLLTFNESLDSTRASTAANYTISDGINTPVSAIAIAPSFRQVMLVLGSAILPGKIYTIVANTVTDCSGNVIQAANTTRVGLASIADTSDIIINEILFNPPPSTVDYVEIYNRSQKIIDLKDIYLTNRSSTSGQLGTLKQLSSDALLMYPGDFYVLSENDGLVKQAFTVKNPDNFINISSMPSFPDDKGVVILLSLQGKIVDELAYDLKWHFSLLDNKEGISLERIDYNKPTQNRDNWFSAASTSGFGTPSYQNSQFRADLQPQGDVSVSPKVFSPDNDGTDDFTTITYQMTSLGYVANITIFDAGGRPVKVLAKNATLALKGAFRWDGLDDKMNKLPIGTYVVFTDVFNLDGKRKSYKQAVVLARRF